MLDVERTTAVRRPDMARAAAIVREQEARLVAVLDEARQVQAELQVRLRQTNEQLKDTTGHALTASARIRQPSPERTVADSELREREQTLRRQQQSLSETLATIQSDARKLRAIIKQAQLSADYLMGTTGDHDADLSLTHVWALEAQEEERRRIAREIHDGPAQVLANAIFQVEYCQRLLLKNPAKADDELTRLKADLREGLAEVRYCIFDLRPGPLAELGLAATVQRYAEAYHARYGVEMHLDLDHAAGRMPLSKEIALFRIIQEALQNVHKHATATLVRISLLAQADDLVVVVEDNGRGFDLSSRPETALRHFGLTSMQERARLMRAEFRLTSSPGAGTRIEVRVPADNASVEA